MTRDRPILITGGAGIVGRYLTQCLAAGGATVRILDLHPPPWPDAPAHLVGDVRDPEVVAAAVHGTRAVVHAAFAAPSAGTGALATINVDGTQLVLEAASREGVARFVLVSSTIVSRRVRAHPVAGRSPQSRLAAYARTRRLAEALVEEAATDGLSVAIARPKTLLAPGRLGAFALMFDAVHRGAPVTILGSGTNRYQLLDTRDLATGLALLVDAHADGVFDFGATRFGSVRDELSMLLAHAGTGSPLRTIPGRLATVGLRTVELLGLPPASEWHQLAARAEDSTVDTSRARRELGWEPRRSNLDALTDAYDWYVTELARGGRVATPHPVPRSHRVIAALAGRRGAGGARGR